MDELSQLLAILRNPIPTDPIDELLDEAWLSLVGRDWHEMFFVKGGSWICFQHEKIACRQCLTTVPAGWHRWRPTDHWVCNQHYNSSCTSCRAKPAGPDEGRCPTCGRALRWDPQERILFCPEDYAHG